MPNIYHHRDFRSFVQAWMSEKEGRGRSLRAVAKRMGKSAGGLSRILGGDRAISEEIGELFAIQMKLGADEAAYFRILIDCEQAPSEAEREEAALVRDAIFGFRNAHRLDAVQARYFSSWIHPAIMALVDCRGFRSDPVWIARTLQPPVTPDEVRRAIQYLLNIQLLVQEDGELRPPHRKMLRTETMLDERTPEVAVPADPGAADRARESLKQWHQWLRRRAAEALDEYPREERVFNALTLRVSKSRYDAVVKRMEHLLAEVGKAAEGDEPADRVYQLTVSLFPVSASTDEEPST